MLRASSLGLHLPPTTILIFPQCLRAPGVIIGHRSLLLAHKSSALHLPAHPRQASYDARPDTESFRPHGTACPVVFSSSMTEDQVWPSQRLDNHVVEEVIPERGSDSVEAGLAQETGIGLSTHSATESMGVEFLEEDEEQMNTPTLDGRVENAPFLTGRPWSRKAVRRLRANSTNGYGRRRQVVIPSPEEEIEHADHVYQDMLYVLATTSSAEDGWKAYGVLSRLQQQYDTAEGDNETAPIIPFAHLHRLARVLSSNTPKTRTQFLRLLSVLTTIQNYGGVIHLHEWNALIDHAGKGLRKTRPEDFNNSLSIFYDMIYNRPPGSRFSGAGFDDIFNPSHPFADHQPATPAVEPDIHTFTTLIDIAARTNHPPLLDRATMLLKQAKLPPNRITHLSLLKYFTAKKQLSGVRSTVLKMKEQNLELGVDGLNACMWAYGHNHRVDVVMMIYRLLRHNVVPEEYDEHDSITSVQEQLRLEEGIEIAPNWRPNEVTFTLMIQTMAYHGNFLAALSVFIDMLSSPNVEQGAPLVLDENGDLQPTLYSPSVHTFRAILLGFSRHGVGPKVISRNSPHTSMNRGKLDWNLENLQNIFEKFLELPPDTKISESTIFWTLNSFSKTSDHDVEILRTVWQQIENRFGRFKGGPNHRLTKWRHKLFPEAEKAEDSG